MSVMPIRYEKDDEHVVLITIDRPPRNALDMYHFRDLAGAWRRFKDEPDAWVAIITGVGESFCVGADVKIYKPIIGAINGFCVAGGMEMLGGIDIRIASPNASFAVMEPKRGLFAGGGTTVRLPRQIPFPAAMEFLLTADRIDAPRALDMGLVNQVVPSEDLLDAAYTMARRITVNAPLAVQATKESVLRCLALPLDDAYKLEQEISSMVFQSEDAKEGPKA